MEILQRIELLAGADELDRAAGDGAHGKRGTAARIAIDPGQHDAGHAASGRWNGVRDVDRVLAGHGIDDQQGLGAVRGLAHRRGLGHQLLVDMQAAGGIEHDHVDSLRDGRSGARAWRWRPAARPGRSAGSLPRPDGRAPRAAPGRRAGGCRARPSARLLALAGLEAERDLGRGGRLARALQARPSSSTTGAGALRLMPTLAPPRVSTSASWTIFTTIWPGVTLFRTLSPTAFSRTAADEVLAPPAGRRRPRATPREPRAAPHRHRPRSARRAASAGRRHRPAVASASRTSPTHCSQ